jgi:hypothetical protein
MWRLLPEQNVTPKKPAIHSTHKYNQYLPSWNSGEIGTDFQEGEYDGDHEGSKEAPTAGKHLSAKKLVVNDERKTNYTGDDNNDDDNDEVNSLLDDFYRFPQTKPRVPFYLGKNQVDILEREFIKDPKPATETKRQFAKDLKVPLDKINVRS